MKLLKMANGEFYSKVDDHWFEVATLVGPWYRDAWGYPVRYIGQKDDGTPLYQRLHNLIKPPPDGFSVDHINCDPMDNREENLRFATQAQQLCNTRVNTRNTSGYKCVSWNNKQQKWHAYIMYKRKRYHLGFFLTIEEAAIAYNKAAIQYFGEFARLNIIGRPGVTISYHDVLTGKCTPETVLGENGAAPAPQTDPMRCDSYVSESLTDERVELKKLFEDIL